jgi:tetratricopeptide (TPR) repeat protein
VTATGEDDDLAMRKYEEKDFSGALADFERTLAKDPDNYNALFYSAVSYLSTGQTDKAIINLNKVLLKKDGALYDAAQWYLSLAYIKNKDTKNARKNLVELQKNSNSRYQKQADETLKAIEK